MDGLLAMQVPERAPLPSRDEHTDEKSSADLPNQQPAKPFSVSLTAPAVQPRLSLTTQFDELAFPLSDEQIFLLNNEQHLRVLAEDLGDAARVYVDDGLLTLRFPADLPCTASTALVHTLEMRLGTLLTLEDIADIR